MLTLAVTTTIPVPAVTVTMVITPITITTITTTKRYYSTIFSVSLMWIPILMMMIRISYDLFLFSLSLCILVFILFHPDTLRHCTTSNSPYPYLIYFLQISMLYHLIPHDPQYLPVHCYALITNLLSTSLPILRVSFLHFYLYSSPSFFWVCHSY